MSQFICEQIGKWRTREGEPVKSFPLQLRNLDTSLPLPVAEEAYKEYVAQYGNQQSLERLAQRGGFGAAEIATLLFERIKRLESLIEERQGTE